MNKLYICQQCKNEVLVPHVEPECMGKRIQNSSLMSHIPSECEKCKCKTFKMYFILDPVIQPSLSL